MKILLMISMLFALSGSLCATEPSDLAGLFHQRLIERWPHVLQGAKFELASETPDQVKEVINQSLDELLDFASELDLFSRGFSYALSPEVYEAKREGQVIDYTFSIVISKDGVSTFRRFYNLARRVDGVFYVDHLATYDL